MTSWATKQKTKYISIVVITALLFFAVFYVAYLIEPESCTDGKKNQDETGIDCGGSCSLSCISEINDLIVEWSRSLERFSGLYDALAFVENPNIGSGISLIEYTFKIYDKDNLLIIERSGKTFVNSREKFLLVEGDINVGERIPSRTFVTIKHPFPWIQALNEKPELVIINKKFELLEINSRLKATLVNNSFFDVEDIFISALLFDTNNNVISISTTVVDFLVKEGQKDISFIFPHEVNTTPARITVLPRVKNISVRE